MLDTLQSCTICPRQCLVNRFSHQLGFCQTNTSFHIGSICIHKGEEPVFGSEGMVNVFFTRCNLHCSYCQNHQISDCSNPQINYEVTLDQVVQKIMVLLSDKVTCVGFVSPSHVLPQMKMIIDRIRKVRPKTVFVMNTNAFDRVEQLKLLEGWIDVYLPDLKYVDAALAKELSSAEHYPVVAKAALKEMFSQKGSSLVINHRDTLTSGLIIRHLILPGQLENTRACLEFISTELSSQVHVSIMAQYKPIHQNNSYNELNRTLTKAELEKVMDMLEDNGLESGWVQDLESSDYYSPDFKEHHPFE